MNKISPIILILLFCATAAFAQTELPTIGSLSDIENFSKIYLVMDNESRKAVLKQIGKQKSWKIVEKPEDAEFFIEYKTISRQPLSPLGGTTETGQMDIYIYRDKKKIIAWTESTTGGGFKGDTANNLIKKFLKDFKSSQSKK